jgi:inosine/xanthosine triphosphate pyrophosphatase family protein
MKKIYLLTSNNFKYEEIKTIFNEYNIKVEKIEPEISLKDIDDSNFIIKESSGLYDYYTNKLVDHTSKDIDCLRTYISSVLIVWYEKEDYAYINKTEGYLDLSKKSKSDDVFGWDDIFVVKNTSMSYYEKKKKNFKISPRDNNISDFIHEHVYYKNRRNFKFTKTEEQKRTIDFENTGCVNFLEQNKDLLFNYFSTELGLNNLFIKVCNEGAFFRSVQNTRENIYWCPGMNAGIPHIQKKDKIHELTFTVHDFFHFLIPDLIFTGKTDKLSKNVYIITRMLSEAITIVLADMVFIETLKKSNVDYDWTKRKIWPLYDSMNKDFSLKEIIIANVKYCLLGDSSDYKCYDSFKDFHDKYTPFFVEDYKWTNKNWNDMSNNKTQFNDWWKDVKTIRDHFNFGRLESTDEYIQRNNLNDKIEKDDLVFIILDDLLSFILPVLKIEVNIKPKLEIANCAFGRWIIGQFLIFSKFSFLQESKIIKEKIKNFILDKNSLSFRDIQNVRGLYEQYLDILFDKGLVSKDDKLLYSEIFPIFKPSFANYDKGIEKYQNISDVWVNILKKSVV